MKWDINSKIKLKDLENQLIDEIGHKWIKIRINKTAKEKNFKYDDLYALKFIILIETAQEKELSNLDGYQIPVPKMIKPQKKFTYN